MTSLVALARRRVHLSLALLALAACAGATPSPTPAPNPSTRTTPSTPAGPTPLTATTWPVRTREHVDLWLHTYALLSQDTTLVPYFRRGYRDRMIALRRQRGVSTQLDASRGRLADRMTVQPALSTSGQFLPLYFESWDQMRQAIDLFVRANGNPNASNDPATRTYIAILGSVAQSAADRDWLRLFAEAADDESRRFYHDYWTGELRTRSGVVSHVDSLWQLQWRPSLQRFLNNTQQQNGELYLSLPLGGEGRTIHFGKQQNAVAVTLPDGLGESDAALYVMVHEVAGAVASTAIEDNTTPADRRNGVTSRYEQAAAVRAGALLLERTIPNAVPGYMRYYLQAAGRTPPNDPRAAFTTVFALPDAVTQAIVKQFEVILGGI
jgi:hypothetical protein